MNPDDLARIREQIDHDVDAVWRNYREQRESMRQVRHRDDDQLAMSIYKDWGEAFELYDDCQQVAASYAVTYLNAYTRLAEEREDWKFVVLQQLFVRASNTVRGVGVLLRSGHGLTAEALVRAIYELAVVANFIQKHDAETARRYTLHQVCARVQQLEAERSDSRRHGIAGPDEQQIQRLQQEQARLVALYGKGFTSDYGWAARTLRPDRPDHRPQLSELEVSAQLQSRFFHKYTSNHLHPGSFGGFAHIRPYNGEQSYIIGPRKSGLAYAGKTAMGAFLQCTNALLMHGMELVPQLGACGLAADRILGEMAAAFDVIESQAATDIAT